MWALMFLRRDLLEMASYRLATAWRFASMAMGLLGLLLVSRMVGPDNPRLAPWGGNYFLFSAVGLAMGDAMWSCLKGCTGRIRYDQMVGTLENLLAGGLSVGRLLAASALFPMFNAVLRSLLYLTAAFAISGGIPPAAQVPAFLPIYLLGVTGFGLLGVASAALTLIFKRGEPLSALFGAVSLLLGGTVYPLSALPPALADLSAWLPLTRCIEAARTTLLMGQSANGDLMYLAVFNVAALALMIPAVMLAERYLEKWGGARGY
jgi:ABC-2 type transport system permease protein